MKKLIVVIFILNLSLYIYSQEVKVTNDIGFWGGISLEKKVFKNFRFSFDQQLWLNNNFTKIDDYISDLGVKYSINENFSLGTNARFIHNKKRFGSAINNFRYNLDLRYKTKFGKRFKFYYRFRYQKEFEDFMSFDPEENIYSSKVRNRIKVSYNKNKKNRFYLSAEIYRMIERYREPYYHQWRFFLGDEISTKAGSLICAIGYEHEIKIDNPYSFVFAKIKYVIKL